MTIWKYQILEVIRLQSLSGNGPHLAWMGEPPGFSRVAEGALDLRWDLRDRLWFPQERPVPMRVVWGHLGIPLPSMLAPYTLCESVPEPENNSPVLT